MRFAPEYGVFAAAADGSPESQAALAALCPAGDGIAVVEADEAPTPPGLAVVERGVIWQMLAETLAPGDAPGFAVAPLTDADGPEMLALATLTKPGPFFERTHRLGDFIGVKVDGRLAAMAGERMRAPGFTEVSGVCTHPDHRGRGYAAALTRIVAANILARGETPFMHVFPSNAGAISVYQALGFRLRREMKLAVFSRPG
ncbi:MAG TPA: GNAT family N-acetyltransferase [Caulobacteraceae bacterium]|nr:GNAT family N-acetyltransferase [Caulobacteraceae bacterium]